MERSTIIAGKINYFDWAIFNSYVSLPEGSYILIVIASNLYLLQCEAPKIAKLVYNSNNYGLWYL